MLAHILDELIVGQAMYEGLETLSIIGWRRSTLIAMVLAVYSRNGRRRPR
jgi:hypothetical protein